jgi:hypothetical protein
MRAVILARMGRLAEARESALESLRGAVAFRMPNVRTGITIVLVDFALRMGAITEAETLLADLPEEALLDVPVLTASLHLSTARIHAARGERDQAERQFRRALENVPRDEGFFIAEIRRHFARFLIDQGRGREAREHIEWLLTYYSDPVAKPRYLEAQALMAECEAVAG